MDYIGIIKKAYAMTLKHKFLWIFGILAGGVGFFNFNLSWPNFSTENSHFDQSLASFDWTHFWINYGGLVISLLVILGVAAILLMVLNIISQAALVASADRLARNEECNFKIGFRLGAHQFWRLLGMSLLYFLMILASLIVLAGPIIIAIINKTYVFAVIWGILLFFVCLAFWILVSLIYPYSLRVLVLEKSGLGQSIRQSLHFFRDHWKEVVVMYLLLLAISFVFALAMVMAGLLVGGIILAIGFGIFLASHLAAVVYAIILGLLFLAALAVIGGVFNTFYSISLTLTYNYLVKPTAD